jgi:histidinol-phosphatase (PHP family)
VSPLFDYHTHSRFCDGKGELSEYVEAAAASGLESIGLSGHAPCPVESDWHMKESDLGQYLATARDLARSHEGRIRVLVGLEADYIPGVISPRAVREANGLDYVMGGVHYLGRLLDGTPWTIDGPFEELQRGIRESFGGDARLAVARYFELVGEMAASEGPDVIAHFDLIKKNNRGLFDEGARWYQAVAEEALRAVAACGCVVEVNTGAVSRNYGDHLYPADRVLSAMAAMRIPVTLGSDAHRPAHVGAHFGAALDALRRAGYRECWSRTRSSWAAVPLDTLV